MFHYSQGVQDMDSRRTRKNGWNDVVNAYMSKLPANWPFTAVTTEPMIRTAILEKTGRLLNSKLQGRLVPREGGDVIKAMINNALLDYQWDNATTGGAMVEKVAMADQITRLFGAAFAWIYWDNQKNCNELKVIDPRDIFIDPSATHIRNAKWVQVREFTTWDKVEELGFKIDKSIKEAQGSSDQRSSAYESIVKQNRNIEDRLGQDTFNPTVELVREFTKEKVCYFLPKHGKYLEKDNQYKHGKIPITQLRYYPLGDDIYGESEVECVLPLHRAINATLSGFLDEMMLAIRPPLKLVQGQYRKETIEYGPGAQWVMNSPNAVTEMQMGGSVIQSFNSTYPMLKAAFNTAMGDSSLGVSNIKGYQTDKTATEVADLQKQQNNRDQYNQLYLSQFLQDTMLMWLDNNKQYLFDDPSKHYHILRVVGKDKLDELKRLQLDEMDIPPEAMNEIADTIMQDPSAVSNQALDQIVNDVTIPTNPVITNPDEKNPQNYEVKNKLDIKDNKQEADLYITPDDMDGVYDYIPDVKSMAAGAGLELQKGRQKAMEIVLNKQVQAMLQMEGDGIKIKQLLVTLLEDNGYRDAEGLFEPRSPAVPGAKPGAPAPGVNANPGLQAGSPPIPAPVGAGGLPGPQGLPNPGEAFA